mmetsp:Transcript_55603/g.119372  ORF Transcript_55603/g.119372 Transcript_55603/m.119372 type:complete len:238 (+) Transcript_55603:1373-2086(+)
MLAFRPNKLSGDAAPYKPLHSAHALIEADELLAAQHPTDMALDSDCCVVSEEPQSDPPSTHQRLNGGCRRIQLLPSDVVAAPPGLDLHRADSSGFNPILVLRAIRVPGTPGALDALRGNVLNQTRRMLSGRLSDQRSLLDHSITVRGFTEHSRLSQDQRRSGGTNDRSIRAVVVRCAPDGVPLSAGLSAEVQDVIRHAGGILFGLHHTALTGHHRLMLLIRMLLDHVEMRLWGLQTV